MVWIYGVSIRNRFMRLWEKEVGFGGVNGGFVGVLVLVVMGLVMWFGKDVMVKVMR